MCKDLNQKKKLISVSDTFITDFFEINELYTPDELFFIAMLEEDYKSLGLYCVALVKKISDKDNPSAEEFLVISSIKDTEAHKPEVLKELDQKYSDIQGFVVREEGKELQKYWMRGLNDN